MGQSATSVGAEMSNSQMIEPQSEGKAELICFGEESSEEAEYEAGSDLNNPPDDEDADRSRERNQELLKESLVKVKTILSSAEPKIVDSDPKKVESDLEAELRCLRGRNEELEEELAKRDKRIMDLTEQNDCIIEKFEEVESEVMSRIIGTDEKVAQLTDVMHLAERFKLENAALRERVEEFKNLISDRNERISRCLLERDHATGAATAGANVLQGKLEKLQAEYTLLGENLDKSEVKCREYEDSVRSLENTLRCAEEKLKSIVDKLKDEMDKTKALETKLKDASDNLCNDEGKVKELELKVMAEQDKNAALTAKLYELNAA